MNKQGFRGFYLLLTCSFLSQQVLAEVDDFGSHERNPFAMTKLLLKALTKTPEKESQGLFSSSSAIHGASLINGLPHIRLQAVSFGNKKRNAVLEKRDGSTLFVSEGDRLFLIEDGQYVAMNVLEIKPRSILIQLGADGTIIEVQ